MKTKVLSPLTGEQITSPGKYMCIPVLGILEEPVLWVVEIYEDLELHKLVYNSPVTGNQHLVESCGHTFFAYRCPKYEN